MTPRLFRPATARSNPHSPSWSDLLKPLDVATVRVLTLLRTVCQSPRARRSVAWLVLLVGLVVQAVLLLTAAYLCDLALSLMELWADLARKHLELTL